MSETLIALVIIGIIAAITVPNIVAHQREVATVEKVKKFYSTMSQAVKRAIVDTGMKVDEWDFGGGDSYTRASSVKFMEYLKPHLSIMSDDCYTTGKCLLTSSPIYYLNGNQYMTNYYSSVIYYKVILNDGSLFWLRTAGEGCIGANNSGAGGGIGLKACADVWYDVNGIKGPNTLGKDIFIFYILPDEVLPVRNNDCTKNGAGWGCSNYILSKGNMDYLH